MEPYSHTEVKSIYKPLFLITHSAALHWCYKNQLPFISTLPVSLTSREAGVSPLGELCESSLFVAYLLGAWRVQGKYVNVKNTQHNEFRFRVELLHGLVRSEFIIIEITFDSARPLKYFLSLPRGVLVLWGVYISLLWTHPFPSLGIPSGWYRYHTRLSSQAKVNLWQALHVGEPLRGSLTNPSVR